MEKKIPRYNTRRYYPSENETLVIKINNDKRHIEIEYYDFNRDCGYGFSSKTSKKTLKDIYEQLTKKEDKIHVGSYFSEKFINQVMIDIHNKIVLSPQ